MAKRLKQLGSKLKESLQHANNLIEVLTFCQHDDASVVRCAVNCIQETFCHFLAVPSGPASKVYLRPNDDVEEATLTADEKLALWLRRHYSLALDNLQKLMLHEESSVQEAATQALCLLTMAETRARSRPRKRSKQSGAHRPYQFAVFTNRRLVLSLLDPNQSSAVPLNSIAEFMMHDDFRFHILKTMDVIIKEKLETEAVSADFVNTCFALLKSVVMPKFSEQLATFIVDMDDSAAEPSRKKSKPGIDVEEKKRKDFYGDAGCLSAHRRVFSNVWLSFLRLPLSSAILGRVLNNLHTSVMPHMVNPKLLIDFLTDAYDAGGAISLLALNGLFLLITKHNLDYPDFYKKLYALLQPSIFYQKYCSRFFRLADLFLSSSHLPAYMVAAFAKRLSRISLTAPPAGCVIAVAMVTNLLKRHPSCKLLIHRHVEKRLIDDDGESLPPPEITVDADPFVSDEADMAKCHALDSCLWELQCLRNHYMPTVVTSLSLLETVNELAEVDLEPYLEQSYESLHNGLEQSDACLVGALSDQSRKVTPIVTLP